MSSERISNLVRDYMYECECISPLDWLADEEDIDEADRQEFLKGVKAAMVARRKANFVAPDDTPSLDAPWFAHR